MAEYLVSRLRKKQRANERIVSITAYDYFTALIALRADADFVLVGDSLANVVQGRDSTVRVSLEQSIYHTRIVAAHFPANRVVLDMPFGTFKVDASDTLKNAVRAFKETGCGGIKLEGATADNLVAIDQLTQQGVPVLAHLGLLPQMVHVEGGYRMQGKTQEQAEKLLADARAVEQAGAFAIVLECVVPEVAEQITGEVSVPTIGIGSGIGCSGQIIVMHDILGMLPGKPPSFVKQYTNLFDEALRGVEAYAADVRSGNFPPSTNGNGNGRTEKSLYGAKQG